MKRIDKKKISDYINSLLKDRCYVGLHSIVDSPTTSNLYTNLSKKDKAVSILEHGLINSRGGGMNRTVKFFGDLSVANADIKKKMSEYYEGIGSKMGENYVAVVAIPYFFEGRNRSKYFGGYKNYDSQAQFNEDMDCYMDHKFSHLVPPEMILGYYTYDDNEKNVTFVSNPRYYTNLSEEERIKFVEETFANDMTRLNVSNPAIVAKMESYLERYPQISRYNDAFSRTISQFVSLKKENLIHSQNTKKDAYKEEDFISQTVSNIPIQLEYPDFSIHNVECYRFAKVQLSYEDYVYFIEYKDVIDDSGKEVDCYAILENVNGVLCKSSVRIDYNLLNQNVIREMDLGSLPTTITMKGSKRTQELQTENYKENEKHLEKKYGSEVIDSKISPNNPKEDAQLQDIYIVVPTYPGENYININKLVDDFNWYGKFASFSVDFEEQDIPTHQEKSYSSNCKILNSCELDEKAVQDIISYLNKQAQGETKVSASRVQELVSGNNRYHFITSSDNQYNLATTEILKKIYLPSKIGHEEMGTKEMIQRYMSGTAFGMEKYVGDFGESYGETKPQLREKDKAKLNLILEQNKLLRSRENYPYIEGIYPHVTDSYELDDALVLLKKHNTELKNLSPLTQEQLEEKRKRQLQAFSEFFSAIGANTPQNNTEEEQNTSRKNR